ncbi:hypothetical protein [uncultured Sphingomonas sp.]|uniref:hypothetical protein n=1 Tax=uncultured Sphingomonas sp. TaxID=158754 RepID=UPI002617919B|nr:hypothetical protein [uncultured Sphingomonas sp.]
MASAAPNDVVVQAFMAARAHEDHLDQTSSTLDTLDVRTAQFARHGAEHYAINWGIRGAEHGALVALLAASRLDTLVGGYGIPNDRRQKVVTFGIEEMNEVRTIKHALLNLWKFLDPGRDRVLAPLAVDLGLVDQNGQEVD